VRKRLPPGVVRAIRLAPCGDTVAAREFDVALSTVANIRARRVHFDVPDEWPAPEIGGARRLTDEQVRAIRASAATLQADAARYGVSITTIRLIRKRQQIYLDVA